MELTDIDQLLNDIDSKYSLCIALAKRARELGSYLTAKRNMERVNVVPPLIEIESHDPLEIALTELKDKKVSFVRVNDGIK
jgi:DNA-directed RNA polymerase omega subunit